MFSGVLGRELRCFHACRLPSNGLRLLNHETQRTPDVQMPRIVGQPKVFLNESYVRAPLCQAVLAIRQVKRQVFIQEIIFSFVLAAKLSDWIYKSQPAFLASLDRFENGFGASASTKWTVSQMSYLARLWETG
jgi:hypothetical protein